MSFTKQEHQGLIFHQSDQFSQQKGVLHGFATRLGGVSEGDFSSLNLGRSRGDQEAHVRENYRRFGAALGGALTNLVLCRQVHSHRVEVVTNADALPDLYAPTPFDADGMITNVPGLSLVVFYADCIPVLLYDPVKGVVGAVHSGWRGTGLGIAPRAVTLMGEAFGSTPADIIVAIGPGICPLCFETHEDVPTALRSTFGSMADPWIKSLPEGKFQIDLKGMIAESLCATGIPFQSIHQLPLCTACHPEWYWSHRRQGEARGNQAAVIALT